MSSKIDLFDEYLEKCEHCTIDESENLIKEITTVFQPEIPTIRRNLDTFNKAHMYEIEYTPRKIDCIQDVKVIQKILENYKANLEYKLLTNKQQVYNFTQTQNSNISINVSFEQTISAIEAIPTDTLSQDEKEQLEGKLSKINTEKDKSKLWEKAQSALKWIADKSIEVGIAALPYIAEALKNAK